LKDFAAELGKIAALQRKNYLQRAMAAVLAGWRGPHRSKRL
jgi:hypothetical protein